MATPAPFIPFGFPSPFQQPVEPDRGFIGTLLHEIGRDITGAFRTIVAPFGSLAEALGLEAPVTLEDLESRDLVGAASIASLFVGGLAGAAIKGVRAGVGARAALPLIGTPAGRAAAAKFAADLGIVQRAALAASSEAAAGAFFGAVRPLEDGEDRLEAILSETALFAGLGGGFSMIGSAVKATVGARLAELKGQTQAALLAQMAREEQTKTFLREFAGIRLRNPVSKGIVDIKRLADGTVRLIGKSKDGDFAFTQDFSSFNDALSYAFREGYLQRFGVARSKLTLTNVENLDRGVLEAVTAAEGNIRRALGTLELSSYQAVRELVAKSQEKKRLLTWLGIETVTESVDELGQVVLTPAFRQNVLRGLPRNVARRLSQIENDADFLREAIMQGAVSLENIADATQARDFIKELVVNGMQLGKEVVYAAKAPYDITFLSRILTPNTVARIHPEVRPLFELADQAAQIQNVGTRNALEFLHNLENTIPTAKAEVAVNLIDQAQEETFKALTAATTSLRPSTVPGPIAVARDIALRLAQRTGDEQVISFMEQVVERLNHYRLRAVAAGRLGNVMDSLQEKAAQARQIISQLIEQGLDSVEVERQALQIADQSLDRELGLAMRELLQDAGLAGYFPILNLGGFRLEVNGEFRGFFDNFHEALQAARDAGGTAFITPATHSFDASTLRVVSGKEFGRLVQAIREAEGFEITSTEAAELLKQAGTLPSAGPRKYSRFLQKRRLGIRDFSEDPFTALRFYMMNMERTLAFNTLEREARSIIDNIPVAKKQLAAWAEDYVNLILGRPTTAEELIQNFLERLAPGQFAPLAARRWSIAVRRFQSIWKLGGFWSGLVNATQIATNTAPVIGVKWTAVGLEGILNPKKRQEILKFFADQGIDFGVHTPLTKEGEVASGESVIKEIKAAIARAKLGERGKSVRSLVTAFENAWMFSFNSAERLNRLATAWGAYQKALHELGMSDRAALTYAQEVVEKTQFNYRVSNIPTLLQGPIGALLGQFKSYFINEMELIASVDNRTRLKMLAAFQAAGGLSSLLALPVVDLVDAASRFMFDNKLSEALRIGTAQAEAEGEDMGGLLRFVSFGAPGLLGVDVTDYIGPGGLSELMRGWAGPSLSDLETLRSFFANVLRDVKTTGKVTPGTWNEFFQRALPSQIRRIERGLEIIESGEVRNPYSRKLIYRPDDRIRVGLLQMLGAPDLEASIERTLDEVVDRTVAEYRAARESYARQAALALIEGNTAEASEILQEARSAGIVLTARDMRRWVRNMQMPASERRLRRTPVDLRDDLLEFYGLED